MGDELREVNGVSIIHKRPDEISQLLVRHGGHAAFVFAVDCGSVVTTSLCLPPPPSVPVLQSQSHGPLTLKIIPAIKEEGRLRESQLSPKTRSEEPTAETPSPDTNS